MRRCLVSANQRLAIHSSLFRSLRFFRTAFSTYSIHFFQISNGTPKSCVCARRARSRKRSEINFREIFLQNFLKSAKIILHYNLNTEKFAILSNFILTKFSKFNCTLNVCSQPQDDRIQNPQKKWTIARADWNSCFRPFEGNFWEQLFCYHDLNRDFFIKIWNFRTHSNSNKIWDHSYTFLSKSAISADIIGSRQAPTLKFYQNVDFTIFFKWNMKPWFLCDNQAVKCHVTKW